MSEKQIPVERLRPMIIYALREAHTSLVNLAAAAGVDRSLVENFAGVQLTERMLAALGEPVDPWQERYDARTNVQGESKPKMKRTRRKANDED